MFNRFKVYRILLLIICSPAQAAIIEHYNIDFSSPTHIVGYLPTTGTTPDTISRVNFGQPIVESDFGSLTDQPLVFNPNTSTYEQIQLNLGLGFDNYNLSFDIETANLNESLYSFNVIFDSPQVQNLNFHGSVGLYTFNSGGGGSNLGAFSDNTLMHVNINVDLINNIWMIDTGVLPVYTGVFNSLEGDVSSIRFNLSPWYSGTGIDSSISVGIDNIIVSSSVVPLPAALWLFMSGFVVLITFLKK